MFFNVILKEIYRTFLISLSYKIVNRIATKLRLTKKNQKKWGFRKKKPGSLLNMLLIRKLIITKN